MAVILTANTCLLHGLTKDALLTRYGFGPSGAIGAVRCNWTAIALLAVKLPLVVLSAGVVWGSAGTNGLSYCLMSTGEAYELRDAS